MIYFTADTHFFHKNIIRHANRPFQDIEEMHEQIIENWNSRVRAGKKDTVYILGDFSFENRMNSDRMLRKLYGDKYLITGNHDIPEVIKCVEFNQILHYKELKYNDRLFIMSHYPMISWKGMHKKKSIMLHGHCHGKINKHIVNVINRPIIDVGIDCWNYNLVSIDEIIEYVDKQNYNYNVFIDNVESEEEVQNNVGEILNKIELD